MPFRLYLTLLLLSVLCIQGCSPAPDPKSNSASESELLDATKAQPQAKTINLRGTIETPKNVSPLGTILFAEGTSFLAVAANDGEFVISNLPAGQYNLYAVRQDLKATPIADVVITQAILDSGNEDFELEAIVLDSYEDQNRLAVRSLQGAGVVKGRVITPRPRDLMGILVEIDGTDFRTSTDTQGQYTLVNIPQGVLTLRFTRSDYTQEVVSVNVSGTEQTIVPLVTMRLRTPGAIGGKTIYGEIVLLDIESNPVRNFSEAYITLSSPGTLTRSSQRYYPDERGIFEITGLEAKAYVVSAKLNGFILEETVSVNLANTDVAQVTLLMNENPTTADQTGVIIGQILLEDSAEQGNAGVLVSLAGMGISSTTDSIGTFTLEGVEPGIYTVIAQFNGYETGFIENITLEPREIRSLDALTLKKEVEYPKVVSTSPTDGAADVTIDNPTIVTILFDQPMNVSTVRTALRIQPEVNYSVLRDSGQSNRIQLQLEGYSASGTPVKYDTNYQITLSTQAQNTKGVGLEEDYSFRFKTGSAKVVSSNPQDGAEGVFVTKFQPIRVYFNAPLDIKSLESSDLRFRPDLPASADVYLQNDPQTGWGILTIGADLLFDEEYEVTIPNRVRTITNDRISNLPYRIRFSTTTQREANFPQNNRESQRERIEDENRRK
ncbi:MAG: carboxypeptidase regulatory-like domain-containing protein [Sumerlaeia bacterium]